MTTRRGKDLQDHSAVRKECEIYCWGGIRAFGGGGKKGSSLKKQKGRTIKVFARGVDNHSKVLRHL